MRLGDIYKKQNESGDASVPPRRTVISFEVFPPKKDEEKLLSELEKLNVFNPALISITYGAGGSNKEGSLSLVKKINQFKNTTPMPHFTCMCSSRDFLSAYIEELKKLKIENILALRGDRPKDTVVYRNEFNHANELVEFVKTQSKMSVAVAGYPEGHPEAIDINTDIQNLKRKINAGGEVIFTQLFFNNDRFYRYRELVEKAGIKAPIIAGILPVTNFSQLEKMTSMCKVTIPDTFAQKLEKYKDDPKATTEIGLEYAINCCQNLVKNETAGLHFYTLNKAYSTCEILKEIFNS